MNLIFNKATINAYLNTIKDKRIVFTNGCFDILHPGHLYYLGEAKQFGDILIVGCNSDQSVKQLKGEGRPINRQDDRTTMLLGLKPVDAVVIFDEQTPVDLIDIIKPSVHVKGGDYTPEQLPEYDTVIKHGGRVEIVSFVNGFSTTSIIEKLNLRF